MRLFPKYILTALLPLICLLMPCSCGDRAAATPDNADTVRMKHASLLHICRTDSFVVCDVENPWKRGEMLQRYILVDRDKPLPQTLPDGTLLRTPLRRAVAFSSVHGSLLCELGARGSLCGLCDVPYIINRDLLDDIRSGRLADMGAAHMPDAEKLIAAQPDALLVSPFAGAGYGVLERLGIPLIECADYMETSPLGRAEWMRFFGMLFGREDVAEDIFGKVETEYLQLAAAAGENPAMPKLLVDNVQSGTWYVPCGQSTMGVLFRDAGAEYIFSYIEGSGSQTLAPESVLRRGRSADLWLIKYGAAQDITYESLAADFPLYRELKPWKERRTFGCNVSDTPFFEETPFHPERLLRDISLIVSHHSAAPSGNTSWTDSLRYFKPLK